MRSPTTAPSRYEPMPLERVRHAFDHPEWLFELQYDGFRALAYVNGGGTQLVSRRGLGYPQFPDLASELSLELNATEAVLDGEIVKLDASGRSIFIDLMRRRMRSMKIERPLASSLTISPSNTASVALSSSESSEARSGNCGYPRPRRDTS